MSSSPNAKFTEYCGLNVYDWDVATPTSYAAFDSTWLSLEGVEQILGILFSTTGANLAGATTLKVQAATAANGTGATDVVTGTAGQPDAIGDYVVVAASREQCIAALPEATHFMVLAVVAGDADAEGSGVILTSKPRYQEADLLSNSIA